MIEKDAQVYNGVERTLRSTLDWQGDTTMTVRQPRYSKDEFARRGADIYARAIRPQVEADHPGEFVAIDIETGEYELDKNEMKAADRLRKRVPNPQIWLVHVRLGYLHRFGGHGLRGKP